MASLIERMEVDASLKGYCEELLAAFRQAKSPESAGRVAKVMNETYDESASRDASLLSFREQDVLELMQQRLSNKEIALRLQVSSETVKKHAQNIYKKLNVHGRRQAVQRAEASGLLQD